MVQQELVKERLYNKYIAPTKKKRDKYIGIEIEMPILNLDKEPVDFEKIHELTHKFMDRFGFVPENIDDEGNIIAAKDNSTGDILSYDCSYNNLELSLGKGKELNTLYTRFQKYYTYLTEELAKYHYVLTGMGVNPYRIYNNNIPIPNGRYRMLFHHLDSYKQYKKMPKYFHNYPGYGMFSSASQVQLDVDYEDLITTIDAFSKLEPIKALLFSNSVLLGEHEELLCCRDALWEDSTHGINPHNVGMFERIPENVEELLAYIETTSIYCVERDEKYINFPPINIMEYFKQDTVAGEYFDGEKYQCIEVIPRIEDIDYLRTFKFEDLTFRGTIEFRSVCCQPIKDSMLVAAFHLGLMSQPDKLKEIFDNDFVLYHQGYTATELRKMFVKNELPDFVNEDKLYELAKRVVDLSREGLVSRGYGEEKYLTPLYERIDERTNPAKRMLKLLAGGQNIEDIILSYGIIK